MTNPPVPPEPGLPGPSGPEPELPPIAPAEGRPPVPAEKATTRVPRQDVPFTRTAAAWWALGLGSLVLIVLLIFIAQNLDATVIHFLGWQWSVSTGIAFLVAAICGSLITVAIGGARMVQLRRAARKNQRPH